MVATPIGNLKDITLRALEVLAAVDCVLCEDTRVTRKLLAHFGITKPLKSYFAGNEERRTDEAIGLLKSGQSVALVTDAGTPCISDPGYLLVRACRESGVPVVPVPGASALAAALSVSGLPSSRVLFLGFPPRRKGERDSLLKSLAGDPSTLVFYEAPHRIRTFLRESREALAGRECTVAREVTKHFEEVVRAGDPQEVPERGEFVVIFGPPPVREARPMTPGELEARVRDLVSAGLGEKEALKEAAREGGMTRREIYRMLKVKGRGD